MIIDCHAVGTKTADGIRRADASRRGVAYLGDRRLICGVDAGPADNGDGYWPLCGATRSSSARSMDCWKKPIECSVSGNLLCILGEQCATETSGG